MLTLLFYGQDGSAAKAQAVKLRNRDTKVRPIHAEVCHIRQPADAVDFMPDVDAAERARICTLFGVSEPVPATPAAPPPPPPGPSK